MRDFAYFEPSSVGEAISLMAQHGNEARVIAGGTDLVVDMKRGRFRPSHLVSLKSARLDYIRPDSAHGVQIGAMTTVRAIEKSELIRRQYPIIFQAATQFASIPIRNVATVGGNLCNAAPSADMAPCLICLGATARIAGPAGEREIPLEELFTGSGTNSLRPGEMLVELRVPPQDKSAPGAYLKYTIRWKSDLPVVSVAAVLNITPGTEVCREARIVFGNVAPTPRRALQAEGLIRDRRLDGATIAACAQGAAEAVQARPGSIRASPEYKKAMVRVFTEKVISTILSRPDSGERR